MTHLAILLADRGIFDHCDGCKKFQISCMSDIGDFVHPYCDDLWKNAVAALGTEGNLGQLLWLAKIARCVAGLICWLQWCNLSTKVYCTLKIKLNIFKSLDHSDKQRAFIEPTQNTTCFPRKRRPSRPSKITACCS